MTRMCDCPRTRRHTLPAGAAAPKTFDMPVTKVGAAGPVTVYYDPTLGSKGLALARSVEARVAAAYHDCAGYFGLPGSPVNLIVASLSGSDDGSGGAYHYGCDFQTGADLYIDSTSASPRPLDMAIGLFVAELSECFQGAQNKGWGCGSSNGEALSRVHAEQASGGPKGALAAFATAPAWDQAGRPDWMQKTESTDQDDVATGCGVLYLYWMMSLGHSLADITKAGGGTLADNYKFLTGKPTALADFLAACEGLKAIDSDDPWSAKPAPAPTPTPPPIGHTITIDLDGKRITYPPGDGWKAG